MSYESDEEDPQAPNGETGGRGKERWEDIQRSWETVQEGEDGSLAGMVEGLMEASKRKTLLRDTTPLQRGIIRHLVIILDLSTAMTEKDFRPTRYLLTLRLVATFITTFFEQNPISQIAILGMRDGIALTISPMSGNPTQHTTALQALQTRDPAGAPSLQNALEMARGTLFHSPSHGTREILLIFGALYSSDPGDIHKTIAQLVTDSVRVAVVGLAARVAICQELCAKTNHTTKDDMSVYGVAMSETHYRELIMQYITPPATRHSASAGSASTDAERKRADAANEANRPTLLRMGFPNLSLSEKPTLCACHGTPTRTGYLCPQCHTKVCSLPSQCPGCSMQLIQSTHLARSYHHLFPLRNYVEVGWEEVLSMRRKNDEKFRNRCVGCGISVFPPVPSDRDSAAQTNGHHPNNTENDDGEDEDYEMLDAPNGNGVETHDHAHQQAPTENQQQHQPQHHPARPITKKLHQGASESGRYRCENCNYHFCIHCDVLFHQTVHNCPGCLGRLD